MRRSFFILLFTLAVLFAYENTYSQKRSRIVKSSVTTISINTEPKAKVWIDGILRGETEEKGTFLVKPVTRGTRKLRIRADGFKEFNKTMFVKQNDLVRINLQRTFDQAELAFQEAERILAEDKIRAIDLYRKAIRLRPRYYASYVGLARALSGYQALEIITKARRIKPIFPEISAIEGRVYKTMGEYDKAIDSFDRAIREGKGFQPEAHTGLALLFKDEAENARAEGDEDDEIYYYKESAKAFEKAIQQLSATEAVVYLFLGKIYEDIGEKKKAIAVYETFLRDMPEHSEKSAVESYIYQLKKTGDSL